MPDLIRYRNDKQQPPVTDTNTNITLRQPPSSPSTVIPDPDPESSLSSVF